MPLSAPGLASPGQASPGALGGSAAVGVSGPLSLSASASISVANTFLGAVSGALSVAGTASITIVSASIPNDMLRVALAATYHNRADGTPAKGQVAFRLDDEIRDSVGNVIAARVRHKAHLRDGTFTVNLPVESGGVGYVVVEEIVGADKRRFTITIPATPAAQTLAEVS